MELLFSSIVLAITATTLISGEPACLLNGSNGCISIDEWKDDLICRLLGSGDNSTGLIGDFANVETYGMRRMNKNLRKAMVRSK